ncbi:MAG: hypothetical protein J0H68_04045 [Sphingobacteriia bacterium]|nr:hypothetical protein [Sphingobacteriia bacterium]
MAKNSNTDQERQKAAKKLVKEGKITFSLDFLLFPETIQASSAREALKIHIENKIQNSSLKYLYDGVLKDNRSKLLNDIVDNVIKNSNKVNGEFCLLDENNKFLDFAEGARRLLIKERIITLDNTEHKGDGKEIKNYKLHENALKNPQIQKDVEDLGAEVVIKKLLKERAEKIKKEFSLENIIEELNIEVKALNSVQRNLVENEVNAAIFEQQIQNVEKAVNIYKSKIEKNALSSTEREKQASEYAFKQFGVKLSAYKTEEENATEILNYVKKEFKDFLAKNKISKEQYIQKNKEEKNTLIEQFKKEQINKGFNLGDNRKGSGKAWNIFKDYVFPIIGPMALKRLGLDFTLLNGNNGLNSFLGLQNSPIATLSNLPEFSVYLPESNHKLNATLDKLLANEEVILKDASKPLSEDDKKVVEIIKKTKSNLGLMEENKKQYDEILDFVNSNYEELSNIVYDRVGESLQNNLVKYSFKAQALPLFESPKWNELKEKYGLEISYIIASQIEENKTKGNQFQVTSAFENTLMSQICLNNMVKYREAYIARNNLLNPNKIAENIRLISNIFIKNQFNDLSENIDKGILPSIKAAKDSAVGMVGSAIETVKQTSSNTPGIIKKAANWISNKASNTVGEGASLIQQGLQTGNKATKFVTDTLRKGEIVQGVEKEGGLISTLVNAPLDALDRVADIAEGVGTVLTTKGFWTSFFAPPKEMLGKAAEQVQEYANVANEGIDLATKYGNYLTNVVGLKELLRLTANNAVSVKYYNGENNETHKAITALQGIDLVNGFLKAIKSEEFKEAAKITGGAFANFLTTNRKLFVELATDFGYPNLEKAFEKGLTSEEDKTKLKEGFRKFVNDFFENQVINADNIGNTIEIINKLIHTEDRDVFTLVGEILNDGNLKKTISENKEFVTQIIKLQKHAIAPQIKELQLFKLSKNSKYNEEKLVDLIIDLVPETATNEKLFSVLNGLSEIAKSVTGKKTEVTNAVLKANVQATIGQVFDILADLRLDRKLTDNNEFRILFNDENNEYKEVIQELIESQILLQAFPDTNENLESLKNKFKEQFGIDSSLLAAQGTNLVINSFASSDDLTKNEKIKQARENLIREVVDLFDFEIKEKGRATITPTQEKPSKSNKKKAALIDEPISIEINNNQSLEIGLNKDVKKKAKKVMEAIQGVIKETTDVKPADEIKVNLLIKDFILNNKNKFEAEQEIRGTHYNDDASVIDKIYNNLSKDDINNHLIPLVDYVTKNLLTSNNSNNNFAKLAEELIEGIKDPENNRGLKKSNLLEIVNNVLKSVENVPEKEKKAMQDHVYVLLQKVVFTNDVFQFNVFKNPQFKENDFKELLPVLVEALADLGESIDNIDRMDYDSDFWKPIVGTFLKKLSAEDNNGVKNLINVLNDPNKAKIVDGFIKSIKPIRELGITSGNLFKALSKPEKAKEINELYTKFVDENNVTAKGVFKALKIATVDSDIRFYTLKAIGSKIGAVFEKLAAACGKDRVFGKSINSDFLSAAVNKAEKLSNGGNTKYDLGQLIAENPNYNKLPTVSPTRSILDKRDFRKIVFKTDVRNLNFAGFNFAKAKINIEDWSNVLFSEGCNFNKASFYIGNPNAKTQDLVRLKEVVENKLLSGAIKFSDKESLQSFLGALKHNNININQNIIQALDNQMFRKPIKEVFIILESNNIKLSPEVKENILKRVGGENASLYFADFIHLLKAENIELFNYHTKPGVLKQEVEFNAYKYPMEHWFKALSDEGIQIPLSAQKGLSREYKGHEVNFNQFATILKIKQVTLKDNIGNRLEEEQINNLKEKFKSDSAKYKDINGLAEKELMNRVKKDFEGSMGQLNKKGERRFGFLKPVDKNKGQIMDR